MTGKERASNLESEDHRDFLLKWFWHEGENLNQRTDWFLIFHAILIEAYLAAGGTDHHLKSNGLEIGIFGLLTSFLWLFVGIRNEWHIKYLVECVKLDAVISPAVAHVLRTLLAARMRQPPYVRWVRSVAAFGKTVPLACLLTWLVLVLQRWLPWCWVAIVTGPVAALGLCLILQSPNLPQSLLEEIVPPHSLPLEE